METEESKSASEWLETWANEKRTMLNSMGITMEVIQSEFGSRSVALESEKIITGVCVWDHDNVLEIQVIDLKSKETTLIYDGPCGKKNFLIELSKYENWLKKTHEISN